MARKYQGYARRRGFERRDPGYQGLNRMQQQGDRVISGLKEDQREQLRIEQNYARSLDNNFERSQQNRNDLYQLQTRIDDNRMSAERNVAKQRVRDAETEQRNVETRNRQLAQFSKTLSNTAIEAGQRIDEVTQGRAFVNEIIFGPLEAFEATDEYKERLQALEEGSKAHEAYADNMTGVSEGTRQLFRAENPSRVVRQADARLQLATDDIKTSLVSYQNFDAQLYDLVHKYGLQKLNKFKLLDFATQVQSQRSGLKAAREKVIAKVTSFELQLEAKNRFVAEQNVSNWSKYVDQVARGTKPNGIDRNDFSVAIEQELRSDKAILSNPSIVDDTTFELIVNDQNYPGAQGSNNTIAKRYPVEVQLLRQKRIDANIANSSRIDKQVKAESATKRRELTQQMTEAAQAGEYNYDAFAEGIQRSDLTDDDKKLAQEFNFDASPRGQVEEEILVEIQYRYDNGQEIGSLVDRLRGPDKTMWVDITNKTKETISDPRIPSATNSEKFFKQTARDVLTKEKTVSADKSFETAGRDAYYQYLQRRKHYMDGGMSAYDAHVTAEGEILTLIKSGTGKFSLGQEGAGKPKGFSYYTPEGGYYQDIVKTNGTEALRLVRDNPNSLDETYLITPDKLKNIYNSIQQNTPYQKPFVFRTLEENGYHGGLQRQLNKYIKENNLEPVTVPMSAKQYLSETSQSPRVKRFMETASAPIDYHKIAIIRNGSNGRDVALMPRRVREMYPSMQIPAVEGGIKGLTVQDYFELAFIASAEGTSLEDKVGVVASVLNRLTSGKYGDSIYDIARSPGQYEAVTKGLSQYDAGLAKYFSSSEGQRAIRQALIQLDGRTDFKGQTMMQFRDGSDPMFSSDGNFFHYAGHTSGSGPYTGNVDRSFERFFN